MSAGISSHAPTVGCRVKLTHPEDARHPRKFQDGTIRHVARNLTADMPSPSLVWVEFDDGHRLPFWPNELTMLGSASRS